MNLSPPLIQQIVIFCIYLSTFSPENSAGSTRQFCVILSSVHLAALPPTTSPKIALSSNYVLLFFAFPSKIKKENDKPPPPK